MAEQNEALPIDTDQSINVRDADALFAHLQELVDELPAMEADGARLAKARAAREVVRLERYRQGQENELRHIDEHIEAQRQVERAAKEAGDAQIQENARYNMLLFGNQRGIRQGAEADARRSVERALEQGGFETLAKAQASQMEDETFARLERRIEAFKADYAETLAACQKIEDEEDEASAE